MSGRPTRDRGHGGGAGDRLRRTAGFSRHDEGLAHPQSGVKKRPNFGVIGTSIARKGATRAEGPPNSHHDDLLVSADRGEASELHGQVGRQRAQGLQGRKVEG